MQDLEILSIHDLEISEVKRYVTCNNLIILRIQAIFFHNNLIIMFASKIQIALSVNSTQIYCY